MNAFANRLIVFAASALAAGTMAYGQNRMTAEIPFAFHTVAGTLPAGTYVFRSVSQNGIEHLITVQNTATSRTTVAGLPMFDSWHMAAGPNPTLEFVCQAGACSLRAIVTGDGSLIYSTPGKRSTKQYPVAVISLPLKVSSSD